MEKSVTLKTLLTIFVTLTNCENIRWNSESEFVVVGAGTAGSIVAGRLVAKGRTVTVIEAGAKPNPEEQKYRFYRKYVGTEIDWKYPIEKQENAFLAYGGTLNMAAGKVFGGSSTINAMIYMRGNKADYDGWRELGAEGWGWNDVFPYFQKMENSHLTGVNESIHNKDGPVHISNDGQSQPILMKFIDVLKSMNYEESDPNDGNTSGYGKVQWNYYDGKRRSSYYQYLQTVSSSFLKEEESSRVTRIIFENNKAIGVEYVKKNSADKLYAKATKEVILCAGAIETPKLLMLSGIGPEDHLKSFNIEVIADRPVGKNFHDHIGVIAPIFNKSAASENEAGAVVAFLKSTDGEERSDIEMFTYLQGPLAFMGAFLVRSQSRGEVRLQSTDSAVKPIVNPKYLTDQKDLERVASGTKKLFTIISQMNAAEAGYERIPTQTTTACETFDKTEDAYWQCVVKQVGLSIYHPVGSAKMGAEDDKTAVVNPRLQVLGVTGLRVMDASVMPNIVSSNTMVATMMIAEKGVEMLMNDNPKEYSQIFMKSTL